MKIVTYPSCWRRRQSPVLIIYDVPWREGSSSRRRMRRSVSFRSYSITCFLVLSELAAAAKKTKTSDRYIVPKKLKSEDDGTDDHKGFAAQGWIALRAVQKKPF